jgi:transposase
MQRKRHTMEFKQQVIQEAREVGNASLVARRHDLNPKLLYQWIKNATHTDWKETSPHAKKVASYTPSPTEFREMETQNDQLKRLLGEKDLEIEILRDLLKKANPAYRIKSK